MKRFYLFSGHTYYSSGGWSEFAGDFETIDEAKERWRKNQETLELSWCQIVDSENGKIVYLEGDQF